MVDLGLDVALVGDERSLPATGRLAAVAAALPAALAKLEHTEDDESNGGKGANGNASSGTGGELAIFVSEGAWHGALNRLGSSGCDGVCKPGIVAIGAIAKLPTVAVVVVVLSLLLLAEMMDNSMVLLLC